MAEQAEQGTEINTLGHSSDDNAVDRNMSSFLSADENLENAENSEITDQKRIAQLEQDLFIISKQLEESKHQVKEVQNQNISLKECVNSFENERIDKLKISQELEKSRDELMIEKTSLQNSQLILQSQKDLLESENTKLLTEKRRINDELVVTKRECSTAREERCLLQIKIDEFNNEKTLLEYDKEQWSREREILLQSKQWCMKEISDREATINDLRITMIKNETRMQRDQTAILEEKEELSTRVEELKQGLQERDDELKELREQLQQLISEKTIALGEMEAELRAKERLTEVYKTSSEAADNEISALRESEERFQALLQESENARRTINGEMEKIQKEHLSIIEQKDAEIKRLCDEVAKSTELLNAGFKLNEASEDLISLSPAAAAAYSLLKSGKSLTAIYSEHCRLISELEKKTAENQQIERYVTELIEELDLKAPKFLEQKKAYDQICENNECLKLQNELLSNERQKIQSHRDSLFKELSFTKAELERYQREHHMLTLQVRRLVYIVEKGPESLDADIPEDRFLFENIEQLQKRNIDLSNELDQLRQSQDKAVQNNLNSEKEALKTELQRLNNELNRAREKFSKQESISKELAEQRDNYKALCETNNTISSIAHSNTSNVIGEGDKPSIDMLHTDLVMWKSKADRLQEKLQYLATDREQHEKVLNDRIDQQMEQISHMRMTNGKLESDLEFQKQNQHLQKKQLDSYEKDMKKANDLLLSTRAKMDGLQTKCDASNNQLLEQQQDLSRLKVHNHSLEEQLRISSSREQRLQTELGILRETRLSTERIALTLQGVESTLKRVDAEKQTVLDTQLQSACIERDRLNELVQSLKDQHIRMSNDLKMRLNGAVSDKERAQLELKMLQNNFTSLEAKFKELKEEHERIINKAAKIESTDNSIEACKKEIQQLRNKLVYQEKQISEYQQRCEELNKTVELKEQELVELTSLGSNMENVIREQTEFGTLERQRLQAIKEQNEADLFRCKDTIEELRNQVASLELQLLDKQRLMEQNENEIIEVTSKCDKQVYELEETIRKTREESDYQKRQLEKLEADFTETTNECKRLSEENAKKNEELQSKTKSHGDNLKNLISKLENSTSESEKFRKALELTEQEKHRLTNEIRDYSKREQENIEKLDMAYQEIQKLIQHVSVMEQLEPSGTTQTSSATSSPSKQLFEMNDQGAERFNTLIKYMRAEKQKETELRMNAELELQRVKAQLSIDQQNRIKLESELAKARSMAEANGQAALENEQIMSKLNVLHDIQTRHTELKRHSDTLEERNKLNEKKLKDMTSAFQTSQSEKKSVETQHAILLREIETYKKDNSALRERNEKAMALASKYSPHNYTALQGDFENQKRLINQKDKEIELLKQQCVDTGTKLSALNIKMDEKESTLKKTNDLLAQTRQIGRKYRDEAQGFQSTITVMKNDFEKLQKELEAAKLTITKNVEATFIPSSEPAISTSSEWTAMPAGNANLKKALMERNSEILALKENLHKLALQKEELEKSLAECESKHSSLVLRTEEMQNELDEAREKCIRMDVITTSLQTTQSKLQTITNELNHLKTEKEELNKRLSSYEYQFPPHSAALQTGAIDSTAPSAVDSTAPTPLSYDNKEQPTTSRKRGYLESQVPHEQMILLDRKPQSTTTKRVCVEPEQEAVTSNFDEFANPSGSGDPNESFDIQMDDEGLGDVVQDDGIENIDEQILEYKDDDEDGGYHDKYDFPEHYDENQPDVEDDDDEFGDEEFDDETDEGDDQGDKVDDDSEDIICLTDGEDEDVRDVGQTHASTTSKSRMHDDDEENSGSKDLD